MNYNNDEQDWTKKNGTLSDKTAFKEFGLTEKDIIIAINAGKLHYREGSLYGNPFLRLLRKEVEKLAEEKFGKDFLNSANAKTQLKKIEKELKELKLNVARLETEKMKLSAILKNGPKRLMARE